MASVQTSSYGGRYLKLTVTEESYSIADNTSTVKWVLESLAGSHNYYDAYGVKVTIAGTVVYGPTTSYASNQKFPAAKGSKSGTVTIAHNPDGTASDITFVLRGSVFNNNPKDYSGTLPLSTIPRYATSNQSLSDRTETSLTINWSSDNTIDYVWYSTDNGSTWKAVGSVNATSGSYTITQLSASNTNLSANTNYQVKTRVRRKDSQLTTDSTKADWSTYQYPYVSTVGSSVLTIGNSQTLTLYNPKGRTVTVYMKKDSSSGTQIYSGTTSGTSITFTPTASTLYNLIPNSPSGDCVYYCVYSNQTVSVSSGHKFVVNETINKPTLASSSLIDTNSSITSLTGDSTKIVLNASTLQITVTGTPKNGASISSISIDGSSRTVSNNSASYTITKPTKSSFTVVIIDSRGLSLTTTVSCASIVNYIPLTINGVAKRNQPTDGKINLSSSGNYYNGSFGNTSNTLTTQYRIAQVVNGTPGTWSSWTNLSNTSSNGKHTESQVQISGYDYRNYYAIQFRARDKIATGDTVISTVQISKGIPVYNWDEDEFDVNVTLNTVHGEVKNVSTLEYEVVDTW